ncbi:hypothetical protein A2641_02925 [Candidatus Nomurabacteria bacterium RIFCSPHIGHO2_01_FULL_37_25]|uniref:Endolytic murein transglycosylase n=1 Tax=Candidatus Nomurabacteria bacterium RIFCSPLOWO2_01_FULL_36_16 TaxID=1801767 RepID=A0A1F6X0J2_9BACT|nr:MAG: hypothetical protein A2641_02925 [Candidatus Nomurabacteria bacterium RIFCSPHIGHO2_01_FULL_37_25]OGI75101.1 MAG: hypothetical protein A3D36_03670 [Candidatus Nomurabacteria bacterium RIFCSPHIGHO2_02_FULL_36_29]OGI87612.1 MAG: hypothetical protein A3A91_01745 [Candidatus Nomurabacteria bacterium RIFCSPLOWO2_01_FULL_36_16]OGI97271.1 MAG: hypothetical protein A3I84_01460 [Candidatus Nomurabacteria bacterium RIFCSPLOWO2_02_FULL_36_8]
MDDPFLPKEPINFKKNLQKFIFLSSKNSYYFLSLVLFFLLFFYFFFSAPANFVSGAKVRIEQKSTLRDVSFELKKEKIIRSRIVFEFFVILFGGEKNIKYSYYLFEKKIPVYEVARRIANGENNMPIVMVTIPEGFNLVKIADVFSEKLTEFDKDKFLINTKGREGFLFPDTYVFSNIDNEQDVVKVMSANFEKKIAPFRKAIEDINKNERDIIIMASLIEGEAKGDADREFISGILWKRLSIGMPLQADVAPETYKTKGLPHSPINNPGIKSIKSALYPKSSSYLYYLHDKTGMIHYASTFKEHTKNVSKYLQ